MEWIGDLDHVMWWKLDYHRYFTIIRIQVRTTFFIKSQKQKWLLQYLPSYFIIGSTFNQSINFYGKNMRILNAIIKSIQLYNWEVPWNENFRKLIKMIGLYRVSKSDDISYFEKWKDLNRVLLLRWWFEFLFDILIDLWNSFGSWRYLN